MRSHQSYIFLKQFLRHKSSLYFVFPFFSALSQFLWLSTEILSTCAHDHMHTCHLRGNGHTRTCAHAQTGVTAHHTHHTHWKAKEIANFSLKMSFRVNSTQQNTKVSTYLYFFFINALNFIIFPLFQCIPLVFL